MPTATLPTPPMLGGGMPVIGHAPQFFRDPVSLLHKGYRECGEVFSLRLGKKNSVVLLGPENNKFFFSQTDKLLSIREAYPFFHKMFGKDFYFMAPHDEYQQQREIMMPKFKGEPMRGYVSLMVEETQDLIDELGDEGEFDLIPTLGPLVMNIAAHSFLGRDFRRRLDLDFFQDFRDFSGGMEVIWPLWMPLPHLRKSRAARKKLDRILREWIDFRRNNPIDPPDFFQNLVCATHSDGSEVPVDLMINIILLMVWAGHETTAGQISWTMIDLLQHPEYMNRIRRQTREVLGERNAKDMDWQDARDMVDVELAVKESERLHPVAYILMRKAVEDMEIDGFHIPKDTPLFVAPCVTHRMPRVFANPHVYNPDRFTPGTGENAPETNRLIGFGGGLHRCAGVNFARLEMKIVIALLAREYDMELIDAPRPLNGPSTHWPAQPCRVRYSKRTESNPTEEELAVHNTKREHAHAQSDAASGECPFHKA